MADVVFTLSAEEAKAVQAFMNVVEAQRKTEDGAKKVGRASKQAGSTMESSFGMAALGVMGVSSAIDIMRRGIDLASKSLEDMHERERKAIETNLGLYEARNAAIMNAPTDISAGQIDEMAFFNDVLTTTELADIRANGLTPSEAAAAAQPVGYGIIIINE